MSFLIMFVVAESPATGFPLMPPNATRNDPNGMVVVYAPWVLRDFSKTVTCRCRGKRDLSLVETRPIRVNCVFDLREKKTAHSKQLTQDMSHMHLDCETHIPKETNGMDRSRIGKSGLSTVYKGCSGS